MEGIDISDGKVSQVILFKRSDLKRSIISKSTINQKKFINIFNFRNFIDGQLFAQMVYMQTGEEFLFRVIPGPCVGSEVSFSLPEGSGHTFDRFSIKGLLIDNGKSVVIIHADPVHVSSNVMTVRIGKTGTTYHTRSAKRFPCQPVDALIRQGDREYLGILNEFNPAGLRIDLKGGIGWLQFDRPEILSKPINLTLSREGNKILSGEAQLIREENQGKTIVLAPQNIPQKQFSQRKNRNPRLNLVPKPELIFTHPFTGKRVNYDIEDITSSGLSVHIENEISLLIPGMIIEEATIEIASALKIKCSAQVVYGLKQKKGFTQYGILITDIDVEAYNKLFNILSRSHDPYARVSYDIDMDSLWDFFFETGFIYPDKYTCIAQYKDDFKKTYENLYHDCPDIFASVTYQHNGIIHGHVSLIKAYDRTWLVHHLAARHIGRKITGLHVLNQILNYFDGFDRMKSIGMNYMVFYFRPENRFPNYFFGGLARAFNDPSRLSLDIFAYLNIELPKEISPLPQGWSIRESTSGDIQDLHAAYKQISGGLMVDSFCLDITKTTGETVEDLYKKHGLTRRCNTYTLLNGDTHQAYFIVDHSDRGINLSDLINSIKVILPLNSSVPKDVLHAAICACGKEYGTKTITVQVFPCEYMDKISFSYKKRYVMWVLDTSHFATYIEYIKDMARFNPFKYIKRVVTSFIKRN
jgi:hypothetical protein